MSDSITKKCSKCKEWKPRSEFYKDKREKDGLRYWCKLCVIGNSRRRYKENSEKVKEYSRKRYKENSEKVKETRRKWYKENSEKEIERSRKWQKENSEKVKEYSRKRQKENPEKYVAISQRRRARKAGNGGSFTAKEWIDLCDKYGNKCLCCGEKKKLTADHIKPVVFGGTSNIDNIQPLCQSCNSSKGTKEIDYRAYHKKARMW